MTMQNAVTDPKQTNKQTNKQVFLVKVERERERESKSRAIRSKEDQGIFKMEGIHRQIHTSSVSSSVLNKVIISIWHI